MPFSDTRGFVLSAAACAVVLALSGCGGGGGSASTTPPPGRSMAQLDPEPVALPEGVTLARAGTFTIEPGESVNRDGARFTCAAGGPACAVVVAERAGGGYAATVTGGEVMVAAARVPAPPDSGGGQPGEMEEADRPFPDWPVADAAAARSLVGGSALSWSPSEILNRINRIVDDIGTGTTTFSFGGGYYAGDPAVSTCTDQVFNARNPSFIERVCSDVEYQPVMTYQHGGIPIVQARALVSPDSSLHKEEEIAIGGILDHGYFMVTLEREYFQLGGITGAESFLPRREDSTDAVSTGRWEGALVGTGNSATSPLYRQFIIGDVDVTVALAQGISSSPRNRDIDVAFSNVRNVDTGAAVTLSHTEWDWETRCCKRVRTSIADDAPGYIHMDFQGPNDEEAFGVFYTEEAIGAFGAKKQ